MRTDILDVLIERLKVLSPEKAAAVTVENADHFTLKSFQLDSLDTLQLAMELEERLGLEIEIVDFSDEATLPELAQQLSGLKKKR